MPVMRVSDASLGEARSAIVRGAQDIHLKPGEASVRIISPDELRVAGKAGYATRVGPGSFEFDWSIVEAAIGRPITALDQRVLREGAIRSPDGDLEARLTAVARSIETAIG